MLRSTSCFLLVSFVLVGCPKGNPCGDLMRDPATESCVCPDGFTPRPELGICEGPDGSVIRYDAGPLDAGLDAPDQPDTGPDTGVDSCIERSFFRDADDDGFGNRDVSESACVAPEGFVEDATDCDDECETCFPGGTEVCDERDNDCDGVSDEGVQSTFHRDMDGDTFGDPTMSVQTCEAPEGYVDNDDDCNDACAVCRPGGTEVCEGSLDENCSMGVDEGCACTNGMMRACPGGTDVGACVAGTQTCLAGAWGACMGAVGPIAETCDGVDNDCDTIPDNGSAAASCGSASRATGVGCSGGSCFVSSCSTGYRDCDGMFANGCEAQLGTVSACLACGDVCGWDCEAAGCNDAVRMSAGAFHTCAVRESGTAVCWGRNIDGALGDGTIIDRSVATPVRTLVGITELAAGGNHTCARAAGGSVACWGSNLQGQIGDGTNTRRTSPVTIGSLSSVVSVAAGDQHTCVARNDGSALCWGSNSNGQVGDGTTTNRNAPVPVVDRRLRDITGVVQVASGSRHSCALLSSGAVRCWGSNSVGQLGDGTTTERSFADGVSGITTAAAIAAGDSHTCAALRNGTVVCWGGNLRGQIGDGTTTNRPTPVAVMGLTNVAEISAGPDSGLGGGHTCVRRTDGGVWCWGKNDRGQIGDGTMENRPAPVMVLGGAIHIAVGGDHSCAVTADGGVRCWGYNVRSQLGDGTTTDRSTPFATTAP